MAKRFTSTDIWDEDWFLEMPNEYKLFWYYMLSSCDHAGIFKVNLRSFSALLELKVSSIEALKHFNFGKERIRAITDNVWFIEDFFAYQYGEVFNIDNPLHRGVKKQLDCYKISLESIRGVKEFKLVSKRPQKEEYEGLKDKDKDIIDRLGGVGGKEEVEKKNKFCTKPLPEHFNGLPENKIPSALEAHTLAFGIGITENDVNRMWNVFKTESLTGENFYNSEEKVYTHFLRWIRKQSLNKRKDLNQPTNQINKLKHGDTDKYRKNKTNV